MQRAAVVALWGVIDLCGVGLGCAQPTCAHTIERSIEKPGRNAMSSIRRRDHEAGKRSDSVVLGHVEAEPLHDAAQVGGPAVVEPPDWLVLGKRQQRGHMAAFDELAHIAPVVAGGALGPVFVRSGAMGLHAVTALPRR